MPEIEKREGDGAHKTPRKRQARPKSGECLEVRVNALAETLTKLTGALNGAGEGMRLALALETILARIIKDTIDKHYPKPTWGRFLGRGALWAIVVTASAAAGAIAAIYFTKSTLGM